MSGPITAGFFFAHGTLLLAQAALKEAHAIEREYGEVLEQLRKREDELARTRDAAQKARLERIAALRREASRQAARLERLRGLAQTLAADAPELAGKIPPSSTPPAPAADEDAAWTAHVRALVASAAELEALIQSAALASAARLEALHAATDAAPGIEELLSAYALERRLRTGLDAAEAGRFRETAARILGRLEVAEGMPIPAGLQALAREIVLAPSVERAEALASELRLAVQRQRAHQRDLQADADTARRLLAELPEDAPALLVRGLERVASGGERMDPALATSARQVLDAAAADEAVSEQQAAAYVLEQSLRDLGYEVEDIDATLFAAGGTVHFQRPGWENYFVRMRVDSHEQTLNFNVVRARSEQSAERSRLDVLAEDRWCAEFPQLLKTLAARGVVLNVTRRLDAGAVPVQTVDAATLPRLAAHADESQARAAPTARRIE